MSDKQKKKILLIDDDTSLLVTLSDFLSFEGYEVVTAESGEQGLKKLTGMTPDLIILDMSMPGMGGVGFLKEISTPGGKPKYPVLVLTARANMAEFFADIDVEGFVAKPCDPNDLLMEVSRIVFLRSGSGVEKEDASAGTSKKTALLGEDDPPIRERIARKLTDSGFLVDAVNDGPTVLERAIVERPDVIIVKLVLSNMNGDAVARTLSEVPTTRSIPIILYSDSIDGGGDSGARDAGANVTTLVASNSPDEIVQAARKATGT